MLEARLHWTNNLNTLSRSAPKILGQIPHAFHPTWCSNSKPATPATAMGTQDQCRLQARA
eukprot:143861-Amphidinium_carterae.1